MLLNRFVLFLGVYLLCVCSTHAQSIRINEVQASNTIYQDEDGDTPDWIELYNTTDQSINLEGWSLTDDLSQDIYWTFPSLSIDTEQYIALWTSGKDRKGSGFPRSLVREDDTFRYIIPSQTQANAWKYTDFDDSSWLSGQGGFGYGDGDDETVVPNGTTTIFIRKTFAITDLDQLNKLILDIDYDDAFVAYINGEEVARDNIDDAFPNHLSLAATDKEAMMYSGGIPDQFDLKDYIDLLVQGENVLSIQIYNNASASSDLTLRPFLTGLYSINSTDGSQLHPILDYDISRFHTDFKLSAESETVYLIDPNGSVADSIIINQLPTDISYGRTNSGDLGYFNITTPEQPNSSVSFLGALADDIMFSDDGGQVDALTLALSTSTPFASIRYTTDATIPTTSSTLYNTPINITSSTTVRAKLFRDGYLPSNTVSRNYIIGQDHLLPVMSLITDPINLFDEVEGIYSYGNDYINQLPFFGANFWKDEEKPIHISYYGTDNELKVALNAGVKIFGGWSRAFDQRSLSLFARKKYGPSDIEYPLFDERNYQSYGSIVLRNAGNDNLASNMRDIINHDLIKDLDMETQAYQTVATYINDEYWGIYHMREKVNEHFLANKFGIDPDSLDLLEFDAVAIHGDNEDYLSMINIVTNNDVSNPEIYADLEELIDIDDFIDYFATQIYIDNSDWPGNNNKYWKPKNGKWRWILYDTDFGFNLFNEFGHFNNTLAFALEENGPDWPNPPWSTELFRGLIRNQSFRIKLVNRFADFMNSRYSTANIAQVLDQKIDELQPEMIRHYNRWNGNMGDWFAQINRIRTFADMRPTLMKNHIRSQFELPAVHTITITNPESDKGYVEVSTLTIDQDSWNGDYFENNPFILKAIAKPGYTFSHWTGSVNSTSESLSIDMANNMTVIPHFEESEVNEIAIVINEINYKSSDELDAGDWIELHNPSNQSIQITDWVIKDENNANIYVIPELLLESNGFVIIAADEGKFNSIYTNVDYFGPLGFGLSSDDQVRLFDANNMLIDSVDYNTLSPWPILANGEGYTLELINPLLDNTLGENYNPVNANGSPGRSNVLETSTIDIDPKIAISTFPNPASDILNITLSEKESGNAEVIILDALGRKVIFESNMNYNAGQHQWSINIKHLTRGSYQVKIRTKSGKEITKTWIKI